MNTSISFKSMLRSTIIVLAIIVLAACSSNNAGNNGGNGGIPTSKGLPGASEHPEAIELYRTSCIVCHGAELEGKVGDPSNLQTVGARLSRDEIAETITNGGPNLMPDFKNRLSQDEIALLTDWLAERQ